MLLFLVKIKFKLLKLSLFSFMGYCISLVFLVISMCFVHSDAISCSRTPYPSVCNLFFNNGDLGNLETSRNGFHRSVLEVTMAQAMEAHRFVSAMDVRLFGDKRAKLAWIDCLELYEDTVDKLNKSMSSISVFDHLTWLSASITNHQTCQNGFKEFNLSSYLDSFPPILTTFFKILSNSLALAKASSLSSSSSSSTSFAFTREKVGRRLFSDGFPDWLSAGDRQLLQSSGGKKGDVVVAQDGSGNYKSIMQAVNSAGKRGGSRFVIYVKSGVYKENVVIKKTIKNIMIIGDGTDSTIVTADNNAEDGSTTFRSATIGISGDGFIAQDITFENTAGPQKHQAAAVRSSSDHSVFYRCSIKGYQDTLYVYSQRQFYRDCDIYGTIDFIFGNAVTVIQNCNIYVRKPMRNQQNTVTAQGRTDPNQNTGIIIHNSRITASSDLRPSQNSFKTFLGRPWRKYSRTVIMKTVIDGLINPAGWAPWSGSFALSTLYYGEYMNTGIGANTGRRVKWGGFRVITSPLEAGKFTVGNFLAGGSWIPATGVPFAAGL